MIKVWDSYIVGNCCHSDLIGKAIVILSIDTTLIKGRTMLLCEDYDTNKRYFIEASDLKAFQ